MFDKGYNLCNNVSKRERFGTTYRSLYNVPQDSNGGVALGRVSIPH